MPLHQSLVDLAELAPRCPSPAVARGLLAESQVLLRNAVEHQDDPVGLAAWFSRFVTDVAASPGLSATGEQVEFTGAFARGDGLPSLEVRWFGRCPQWEAVLADADLTGATAAATAETLADAGHPATISPSGVLELRPVAVQLTHGLPDRGAPVDVVTDLLEPIAAVARWATPAPLSTPDRLALGVERERLRASEAEALMLSWETALAFELRRWVEGLAGKPSTVGELPALERSAYGSARRSVSAVFVSLEQRLLGRD